MEFRKGEEFDHYSTAGSYKVFYVPIGQVCANAPAGIYYTFSCRLC